MSPSQPSASASFPRGPTRLGPRLPRGLSALRHPNYRLFFVGQLVSVVGTWMQTTAQAWLVITLTSSEISLGLVTAFQFLPTLLFGLVAGIVADRVPKRRILLGTQVTSGLLAATLAALDAADAVQLWHVYVLALGLGIANAFDMPARQAFVVEMVGKDDLPNAIALNASIFNLGRLVGPALAGVLVAAFGTAICFGFNAASYLAVIAGLLLMRVAPFRAERRGGGFAFLRQGLSYVRSTPTVLHSVVLVGFISTFAMNFQVWVPLLARDEFELEARGFGLLMSALGFGSLAGALTLAFVARQPRLKRILVTAALLGAAELVVALAAAVDAPALAGLLILPVAGFAMTTTMASANTLVQSVTPNDLRGRVLSVYFTVFAGSAPFGALFAGGAAHALGAPAAVALGGLIALLATAAIAWRSGVLAEVVPRRPRAPHRGPLTSTTGKD